MPREEMMALLSGMIGELELQRDHFDTIWNDVKDAAPITTQPLMDLGAASAMHTQLISALYRLYHYYRVRG